jgi:type I restriction enzyme, R subunit
MYPRYSGKQQEFFDFVLAHYAAQSVSELDREKLPNLFELNYQSVGDAMAELGSVAEISAVFIGLQGYLYLQKDTE